MRRYIIIGSILIAVILVVLLYPGPIPYTIRTVGKIVPSLEFVVSRDISGVMSVILRNNYDGKIDLYYAADFERGDPVKFYLDESMVSGNAIAEGDTIGMIESKELELELVRLNGDLASQRTLLDVALSGEKESLIREAENRLAYAQEAYNEQQKIVERLKRLYEADFVPYQDYELALNTLNLNKIDIDIAEAILKSAETGVKQQEIDLIRLGISNIEKEIETLHATYEDYTILSPLSGIVFESTLGDTLVKIGDTTSYAVVIPLEITSIASVYTGQKIEFLVDRLDETFEGEIIRMGNTVHMMNGQQVILVTASLRADNKVLLSGLMVRCSIICEPMTLRKHIRRSFFAFLK
jgi:multidrug efflux pump subunit AcrA (membrane-fusion protein)